MKTLKEKTSQFIKNVIPYLVALIAPLPAFAQVSASPIVSVGGITKLMCTIFGWMFYGLITLSIIMVVVAGFNYVTAGDNAEKVSKANKMILYAIIGIAVALVAKGIPAIVGNFVGYKGNLIAC